MTETQDTIPPAGLGALYAALAKAQGAMTAATKDHAVDFQTTTGRVKYNYATLAGVWEVARKPLADNGLCVIQQVVAATDKSITINTILGHSSGQSISSALTMPIIGGTAQAVGSASMFARRYGMMPLIGVVTDDDDDGQAASEKPTRPPPPHLPEAHPSVPPGRIGMSSGTRVDLPTQPPPPASPHIEERKVVAGVFQAPRVVPTEEEADAVLAAMKAAKAKAPPSLADDPDVPKPLNTWISSEPQRRLFWAKAKELGFNADQVHAVLGVERMGQWPGSLEAALGKLQNDSEE